MPLVCEIVRRWPDALVSVDTVKAAVAQAALDEGAAIINDVAGLRLDPELGGVVARSGAGVVLMHSRGDVTQMARYATAVYGRDPVGDVVEELGEALERARGAGIADDAIVLDPGLGFSKRTEHSVAMIAHLDRIAALGFPVLLGPSRKRFVASSPAGCGGRAPRATIAVVSSGCFEAPLFRVHDVLPVRRALDTAHAIAVAS